jgi:hypothetical protein
MQESHATLAFAGARRSAFWLSQGSEPKTQDQPQRTASSSACSSVPPGSAARGDDDLAHAANAPLFVCRLAAASVSTEDDRRRAQCCAPERCRPDQYSGWGDRDRKHRKERKLVRDSRAPIVMPLLPSPVPAHRPPERRLTSQHGAHSVSNIRLGRNSIFAPASRCTRS